MKPAARLAPGNDYIGGSPITNRYCLGSLHVRSTSEDAASTSTEHLVDFRTMYVPRTEKCDGFLDGIPDP